MKRYAVVQHTYSEFLGLIESQLEKRDIGFNYFRPFVGQDLPGSGLHFDALFLLPGAVPTTEREEHPWIEDELRLIQIFRNAKRPIVGIGFGALLIAEHFGARPNDQPLHTAYWTTAHMTEAGKDDSLAQAVDGKRVFVMYNGAAELPDESQPIVVDDDGNWLAIRPDELTYALLFRPELKPGMLEDMIMEEGRNVPDNIGELLAEARTQWTDTQLVTDDIIVALVKELDLMQERRKAPVFSLKVEST